MRSWRRRRRVHRWRRRWRRQRRPRRRRCTREAARRRRWRCSTSWRTNPNPNPNPNPNSNSNPNPNPNPNLNQAPPTVDSRLSAAAASAAAPATASAAAAPSAAPSAAPAGLAAVASAPACVACVACVSSGGPVLALCGSGALLVSNPCFHPSTSPSPNPRIILTRRAPRLRGARRPRGAVGGRFERGGGWRDLAVARASLLVRSHRRAAHALQP